MISSTESGVFEFCLRAWTSLLWIFDDNRWWNLTSEAWLLNRWTIWTCRLSQRGELLPIVPSDSLSLFCHFTNQHHQCRHDFLFFSSAQLFQSLVASSQKSLHSVFIYSSHSVSLSLCRLGSVSLTFIHELFINLSVEAVALEEIHEVTKSLWIIILSSPLVWSHNVLIFTIVSSAALSQHKAILKEVY